MAKAGIASGKTNRHKSTQKAHTRSQVESAAPRTRGKPQSVSPPKPRAR